MNMPMEDIQEQESTQEQEPPSKAALTIQVEEDDDDATIDLDEQTREQQGSFMLRSPIESMASRDTARSPYSPSMLSHSPSWTSVASSWIPGMPPLRVNPSFEIQNKVLLTSANHAVIHSQIHEVDSLSKNSFPLSPGGVSAVSQQVTEAENETGGMQALLGGLFLTTCLAWLSALDAKNQCRSHQAYAVYDMMDSHDNNMEWDEDQQIEESKTCARMFVVVIVPVCASTLFFCAVSAWLFRQQRIMNTSMSAGNTSPSMLENTSGSPELRDRKFRNSLRVFGVCLLMVISWTYGIVAIMIQPRYIEDSDQGGNPYTSLAAVDLVGHVGDNANLYYTAWISIGLSVALLYHATVHAVIQYRIKRLERARASEHVGDIEAMLSTITRRQLESYRESRDTWYSSLYRLRTRTGMWLTTMLAIIVVLVSTINVWREILSPVAHEILEDNGAYRDNLHAREVCLILSRHGQQYGVPYEMCARNGFGFMASVLGAILSGVAIILHLLARKDAARVVDEIEESCGPILSSEYLSRGHNKHIPLRVEFLLSILLCNTLGLNAFLATGVQGPAAKVGNLYYASWLSFLLCLRICVGCLEELCNIDDDKRNRRLKKKAERQKREEACKKVQSATSENNDLEYVAPKLDHDHIEEETQKAADVAIPKKCEVDDESSTMGAFVAEDILEELRVQRVRHYFFLAIFSTVCMGSALDAAYNTSSDLTPHQKFMIICPAIVAIFAMIQFAFCLKTSWYMQISRFSFGGILSIIMFGLWISNLVLTMSSESTWAVNEIGDIEIANLFYFSWASIITSFLVMMSYIESKLGIQEDDVMTAVWMAVNKVCAVIVGASFHIWQNIEEKCDLEDIQNGAITYCTKTVFAMVVGATGMVAGSTVVASRVLERQFCPGCCSRRVRAHVEAVVSVFLLLLFTVAVASITGIGGPGQSVGDLYYATWLAFVVAIGVFIHCYDRIRLDEIESEPLEVNNLGKLRTIPSESSFMQMQKDC